MQHGTAVAPDGAPDANNSPTQHRHGSQCTCIGDCCCCVPVQLARAVTIAIVTDTLVTPIYPAPTAAQRPIVRAAHALPFATAPPALLIA
jgi:hypothetical protein